MNTRRQNIYFYLPIFASFTDEDNEKDEYNCSWSTKSISLDYSSKIEQISRQYRENLLVCIKRKIPFQLLSANSPCNLPSRGEVLPNLFGLGVKLITSESVS